MMSMLLQGSGSAAPIALPEGSAGFQVMALVEQEVQSVKRLVQVEGDLVSMRKQLTSASGSEAAELQRNIRIAEGIVDGEKAKIAELKARIAEARSSSQATQVIEVPPPALQPAWVQDHRMFGLSKDEFTAIFSFLLAFPLVVALTWRILRRRAPAVAAAPLQDDRLVRLEQAVEAVAIEVERIGESQRFQAKLMNEKPQARKDPVPRVITPV